ncbi:L-serine ammonia-lyase, iron-sulfur-dependent subunit beta [Sedimentibacter saalensis]|uniref:L-serine ammonia-lyase, iron-sulfur-dependent subunit beta n=1 Tax=Sedimentibacter saalensis TaxID=130788 RepID=UPI0028A0DF54|nr:L-serine ammonia-lyase, iron-sulfur-dependent subunit beta [Sedimentibacter saalensis]
MRDYSVFDIIGPIMIGPSSSHTAGAAKLAKIARTVAGGKIIKVDFILHGSFAETYKGHGTDKALVAGILGMDPWDEDLRNSFELAAKEGIEYNFIAADLGDVHPNTVRFVMTKADGNLAVVMGSSIGGGNIIVFDIDGQEVEFTGERPTLLTKHKDIPGVLSQIANILYDENINIANMRVYRNEKGKEATMAIETDSIIPEKLLEKVRDIKEIHCVNVVNPIIEGAI